MTSDELQRIIDKLGTVIQSLTNSLEQITIGLPKKETTSSVITKKDVQEDADRVKENASSLTSSQRSVEHERGQIYAEEFKSAFKDIFPTSFYNNVAEEDAPTVMLVQIAGISPEVIDGLVEAFQIIRPANVSERGTGFLEKFGGIALGGAATGIATGFIGLLRMLATPQVIAGIAVGLVTIVAAVGSFSVSLIMVVKAISYLKNDIISLLPVFSDFLSIIGSAVKDILPSLTQSLSTFASVLIHTYGVVLKELAPLILDFARDVLPSLISIAPLFVDTAKVVAGVMKDIYNSLTTVVTGAFDTIGVVLKELANSLTTVVTGAFDTIGVVLKELAPLILDFARDVLPSLISIAPLFADTAKVVAGVMKDIYNSLTTVVTGAFDTITTLASNVVDIITTIAAPVRDILLDAFKTVRSIISNVVDIITTIAAPVRDILLDAFKTVRSIISTVGDQLTHVFSIIDKAMSTVPDIFRGVLESISSFVSNIKVGVIGSIAGEIAILAASLGALTGGSLLDGIANFFSDSPLDKIIDFQNKLIPDKFSAVNVFTNSLKQLAGVNDISLSGIRTELTDTVAVVGGLVAAIDKLDVKRVVATDVVRSITSQLQQVQLKLSNTFNADKLPAAIATNISVEQNAHISKKDSTFADIFVKANDVMVSLKKAHIDLTAATNSILKEILMKVSVPILQRESGTESVESTFPLQFRSSNILQKLQVAGYE